MPLTDVWSALVSRFKILFIIVPEPTMRWRLFRLRDGRPKGQTLSLHAVRAARTRRGGCWYRSHPFVLLALVLVTLGVVQAVAMAYAPRAARALASAASGTGGQFVPLDVRVLDTRAAYGTGGYTTPMPAGTWRSVAVEGVGSIPASGVAAVAVNFTVSSQTGAGIIHADKLEATPNSAVSY